MPDLWMPGAEKLDIGNHAPTDGGPAKGIGHITWDRNATAANPISLLPFENLRDYFGKNSAGKQSAPHILWDPFTGRFVQFFPANSRSLSLRDLSGGTRTNRAGSVVIQVEALFFPHCKVDGKTYDKLSSTPCKGWPQLQAWVHSWGVPNSWAMGAPDGFKSRRSASAWATKPGWYAHGDVPENDHTDPGSWPSFVEAQTTSPSPYEAFPGTSFFSTGRRSPVIAAMHKRLVGVGCSRYQSSTNTDVWGSGDVSSYAAWQRKLGYTGSDANGIPGPTSWAKLKVPNV